MAVEALNLDEFVDYRAEYCAVIENHKIAGDNLTGRCPFHDDRNNSFSVNLKTGQWKCFAEDRGGNFISFWAELNGISTKDAYREILKKYGRDTEPAAKKKKPAPASLQSYSLNQYAFEKRIPEEFLS